MYTKFAAVRLIPTPPALRETKMTSGELGSALWNSSMRFSLFAAETPPDSRTHLNPAASTDFCAMSMKVTNWLKTTALVLRPPPSTRALRSVFSRATSASVLALGATRVAPPPSQVSPSSSGGASTSSPGLQAARHSGHDCLRSSAGAMHPRQNTCAHRVTTGWNMEPRHMQQSSRPPALSTDISWAICSPVGGVTGFSSPFFPRLTRSPWQHSWRRRRITSSA
mmetsp:Transcript_12600/g.34678  ORF Transcript_12600/g.34678 Transcript_12600/m.34678 type:complete len:224 (-) Transcript_12600:491-1162(-)